MNQILVSEKVYITPELRRKKRLFKIEFFLSVFLVCILSSYYIYAEYDRNKSEQVSQEILEEIKIADTTIKKIEENDVMIIMISDEEIENIEENQQQGITNQNSGNESEVLNNNTDSTNSSTNNNANSTSNSSSSNNTTTSSSGNKKKKSGKGYTTESVVTIPKIGISYPVLSDTSEKLLEISVNKYWGPDPNEVGNYCIVGHNYKNGKMFGQLHKLVNGDIVKLEDLSGRTIKYKVYNKYVVEPTDTRCTSQLTNGKKELTLITCTNYGKQRLVVKCREV